MNHHLHFRPLYVKLSCLFFSFMLYLDQFLIKSLHLVAFLLLSQLLLTVYFLSSALFRLFQLQLHPLLRLLQFFYLILEVQYIEVKVLVLVFQGL